MKIVYLDNLLIFFDINYLLRYLNLKQIFELTSTNFATLNQTIYFGELFVAKSLHQLFLTQVPKGLLKVIFLLRDFQVFLSEEVFFAQIFLNLEKIISNMHYCQFGFWQTRLICFRENICRVFVLCVIDC